MRKLVLAVLVVLFTVSLAVAAGPKTYQVTGPVLELTNDAITVQKGKEKWQIGRDKDTKVKGDLKVGSKVTIEYIMKAATVEAKADAKKDAKKK